MPEQHQPLPQSGPPSLPPTQVEEIRISDLLLTARNYLKYVVKSWWIIAGFTVLGTVAGFIYVYFQDEDYLTESTYIIDSGAGSSSMLSSLMSLAGAFGVSTGGSAEGFTNELLHGIIQSRRVLKGTMMTKYMVDGKFDHLGNHLIRLYPDWADEWDIVDKRLTSDSLDAVTPGEDSLLELMYLKLREDHLLVAFDEFVALNTMTFRTLSRDLSVHASEHILQSSSDFFIQSAVVKEKQSLDIALHQSDSLMGVLKAKESLLARLTDEQGYGFRASDLLTEGRLIRDIEVLSTMYATSYASLEVARTNLHDKKPIIEVVDQPKYATHKEEIKLVAISIIAGIIGAFTCIIFLILRKAIVDILSDEKVEPSVTTTADTTVV